MLKIHKASAGSGKTYTLARSYIRSLLAYNSEGKWRLRSEKQMEDAITHILAITFTNKATNEMKQRIISNLSRIAKGADLPPESPQMQDIPYIMYLHELTGEPYHKIAHSAKSALKVILNNYSLFKISTIDSFFQEILRTFTLEAEINDAYQVEIDSSYVIDAALNSAIHRLDSSPATMGNAAFWLKQIMLEEAKKSQSWNPFIQKTSAASAFAKIKEAMFQLDKEDFKDVRDRLYSFYDKSENSDHLLNFYINFEKKATSERRRIYKRIVTHLSKIKELIAGNNYPAESFHNTFRTQLPKIENFKYGDSLSIKFDNLLKNKSVFTAKYKTEGNPVDAEAMKMYGLIQKWQNPSPKSYYKNWLVYGPLIPYLGLILEVRFFLADMLESNNLIKLNDTAYILKKIIGDSDAPFVYERLGERIHNYLIDEFQDTSQMQWDVIKPLLEETEARGEESLIIGDPKQSIYRFRNACHNLISDIVPANFPGHIEAGLSREENTNWRSQTNIVKFNNFFFKILARELAPVSSRSGNSADFGKLYSNVVQYPYNQDGKGYVEIRWFDKNDVIRDDGESASKDEDSQWFENAALENVGPLIHSLIQRGYRQSDIGILVNTNTAGKKVVESLISFNESLPAEAPKIDFISEESLYIASSPAVELIISVFKLLANPKPLSGPSEEKSDSRPSSESRYINWNRVKLSFSVYSHLHPSLSPSEKIMNFLNREGEDISVYSLLGDDTVPSLAALVELIAEVFMDEDLKKTEGLFIAAFQDLVNEYSQSRVNDPASFLEWWNAKGRNMSVSSPEGTDAVQIMTIHKSKGLEFRCLILPFATDSMVPSPNKDEWRWVEPQGLQKLDSPPVLPVKTGAELLGSPHQDIYKKYYDQVLTDALNLYYVAFTRARDELYVFTKLPQKRGNYIQDFLLKILSAIPEYLDTISAEEKEDMIEAGDFVMDKETGVFSLGHPFTSEEIMAENLKKPEKSGVPRHYFDSYFVNKTRPRLRSIASTEN